MKKQSLEEMARVKELLMLNDEQQKLLHEFKLLTQKMREASILFAADTDDNYYAYNVKNIYDYQFEFGDEPYDVGKADVDKWRYVDRFDEDFQIDFNCLQYSSDEDLFVQVEE